MPDVDPPVTPPGDFQIELVPVGTPLWRIHAPSYQATQMNPVPRPSELAGGRFDSLAGDYSYLYLAGDLENAMAEAIFRDLPLDGRPRQILKAAWAGLKTSELVVTRTIRMAACHGAALAHLGQDLWLTTCAPAEYVKTRRWAAAIRRWAPDMEGLVYRCRNDNDRLAAVLFAPSTQQWADCLDIVTESELSDPVVFDVLQVVALRHNAILACPTWVGGGSSYWMRFSPPAGGGRLGTVVFVLRRALPLQKNSPVVGEADDEVGAIANQLGSPTCTDLGPGIACGLRGVVSGGTLAGHRGAVERSEPGWVGETRTPVWTASSRRV